jgi:hypothetical protein
MFDCDAIWPSLAAYEVFLAFAAATTVGPIDPVPQCQHMRTERPVQDVGWRCLSILLVFTQEIT